MTTGAVEGCFLCAGDGGVPIWRGEALRVVRVTEQPGLLAYYRVIWNAHRAEFTDLDAAQRNQCLQAVVLVEQVLRAELRPRKVNLAALGNVVPHLHWHVVARFEDDSHFPDPVWGAPRRASAPELVQRLAQALPALDKSLQVQLGAWASRLG